MHASCMHYPPKNSYSPDSAQQTACRRDCFFKFLFQTQIFPSFIEISRKGKIASVNRLVAWLQNLTNFHHNKAFLVAYGSEHNVRIMAFRLAPISPVLSVLPSSHPHPWWEWGWYSLWWSIQGGSTQKGYLFSGFRFRKGMDFTSWSI